MQWDELLLDAVEACTCGLLLVDTQGIIRLCNDKACALLGFGQDNPRDLHYKKVLPQTHWPDLLDLAAPQGWQYGLCLEDPERELLLNRSLLKNGPDLRGVLLTIIDPGEVVGLTARIDGQDPVIDQLHEIIESSFDGIYVTDGQAVTILVNRAFEKFHGISREHVLGRPMQGLLEEGLFENSVTLQVLEQKCRVSMIDVGKGDNTKSLITGTPIFDTNGHISMVVTNMRDITQLANLEAQLAENKMKTDYYSAELDKFKALYENNMEVVANSRAMASVIESALKVAEYDTSVLLTGESGTGKGVLANLIHLSSTRKDKPFLTINCGAIPENLLESELFGYKGGAFTGASKSGKKGLFEIANGGTLFLDEVGDIPYPLQVKLLQAVEDRMITPVGSTSPVSIDVRVISATNRDLEDMVSGGSFRNDLFFRLNVVPIKLPPLRERRGDILPLVDHFLNRFNKQYNLNKTISPEALHNLSQYDYPGNVRELSNLIERLLVMIPSEVISKPDVDAIVGAQKIDPFQDTESLVTTPLRQSLNHLEKRILKQAMERYGSTYKMAKALDINQSTVSRKIKKYRLRITDSVLH